MIHNTFHVDKTVTIQDKSDLDLHWSNLLSQAIKALETSYSPYSKFKVGAALILENGEIIKGSNQENASYPLCMCAERVALYTSNVAYNNIKILAIAVTAISNSSSLDQLISPCGACRQVMYEREVLQKESLPILCGYPDGPYTIYPSIKTLLPDAFGPDSLL